VNLSGNAAISAGHPWYCLKEAIPAFPRVLPIFQLCAAFWPSPSPIRLPRPSARTFLINWGQRKARLESFYDSGVWQRGNFMHRILLSLALVGLTAAPDSAIARGGPLHLYGPFHQPSTMESHNYLWAGCGYGRGQETHKCRVPADVPNWGRLQLARRAATVVGGASATGRSWPLKSCQQLRRDHAQCGGFPWSSMGRTSLRPGPRLALAGGNRVVREHVPKAGA